METEGGRRLFQLDVPVQPGCRGMVQGRARARVLFALSISLQGFAARGKLPPPKAQPLAPTGTVGIVAPSQPQVPHRREHHCCGCTRAWGWAALGAPWEIWQHPALLGLCTLLPSVPPPNPPLAPCCPGQPSSGCGQVGMCRGAQLEAEAAGQAAASGKPVEMGLSWGGTGGWVLGSWVPRGIATPGRDEGLHGKVPDLGDLWFCPSSLCSQLDVPKVGASSWTREPPSPSKPQPGSGVLSCGSPPEPLPRRLPPQGVVMLCGASTRPCQPLAGKPWVGAGCALQEGDARPRPGLLAP